MNANKRHLGYTIAAVVAGALCFVGAKQLTAGAWSAGQRALTSSTEVENQMDRLVAAEPMFQALAQHFPSDWAAMREAMVEDVRSDLSNAELESRAHARSRQFVLEHTEQMASAPTEDLIPLINAEVDFVHQLRAENIRYCADFGMRGLQPGTNLNAGSRVSLSTAGVARIVATRSGIDRPQVRDPATEEEWAQLLGAMEHNGASESAISALLDGPEGATVEVQCEGTVHLYRALAALSPELSAQLYAEISVAAAAEMLARP